MNKLFIALIFSGILLIGCTKEETIPPNTSFVKDSTLQTVTPLYARIGDTIEITGNYLDRINFQFNDYIVSSPLYKDSDKARIIVPAPLYNENVTIYAMYGPFSGQEFRIRNIHG